jgi:hypothetical protein
MVGSPATNLGQCPQCTKDGITETEPKLRLEPCMGCVLSGFCYSLNFHRFLCISMKSSEGIPTMRAAENGTVKGKPDGYRCRNDAWCDTLVWFQDTCNKQVTRYVTSTPIIPVTKISDHIWGSYLLLGRDHPVCHSQGLSDSRKIYDAGVTW